MDLARIPGMSDHALTMKDLTDAHMLRTHVIGYDGRRNSPRVANWFAEVAIQNGYRAYISSRPTPTPAIAYFATQHVGKEHIAGIVNCTASHNPSDWQGIKFNPKEGYPAPTHLTNLIGERLNEFQLLDVEVEGADLAQAEAEGDYRRYDPIVDYWKWLKDNGNGNKRIPLDLARIESYFGDKLVLVDEMHGAGKGYLQQAFGELGIRHETLHTERDIDLGDLDYANPERPFIDPLIEAVEARGAAPLPLHREGGAPERAGGGAHLGNVVRTYCRQT